MAESPSAPKRPSRALVIGRFQPPHRGHLACLRTAADAADEVIVVVGSAQRSHTLRDPFTAGERIEMLQAALKDEGMSASAIVPVPDLEQYHLWVAHVAAFVPAFDVVVTGSPMTERLFVDAGHRVLRIDLVERDGLSGTGLRRRLFAGERIDEAVTPSVSTFLSRPHLLDRLQALADAAEGARG